jgi:hypothetical protein
VLTTTEDFPDINLRVDDHPLPLVELHRLYDIWKRDRAPSLRDQPSKARPSGVTDLDSIEGRWIRQGLDLRLRR